MTRDPAHENPKLPPWLRDVQLPPRPVDAPAPSQATETDNWMDRLRAPTPAADSESIPDWL
ncbi:MAG TPA: hypothetical protein PKA05_13705, partial [Roseiflexaceae bacterium]|nr:hypothetical protein [Roseiflexaceae bacterium]